MVSERSVSKKVCVIGAGPSGLVAARELRKEGHRVVVFEQNHDVGGQWLYDPRVETEDPLGRAKHLSVHSSIYASLRLISPREIMGFSDFPFVTKKGRDQRRFPGHEELLGYLRDFCEFFGLREMIRFHTRVEHVEMMDNNGDDHQRPAGDLRWVVKCEEKRGDEMVFFEEVFDAVVVASGHYSQPRMPQISGMNTWRRKQMHSYIYRVPEPFRDEVVVLVGNSFSGQDIAMELVNVAKEVHLSTKYPDNISEGLSKVVSKHDNLHIQLQIESLHEDGHVLFVDGSSIIADTILYCTGYSYSFPFLDTKGLVVVDDDRVGPLYEHTFPPSLAHSLSFIGIPRRVIGFPFFESQAIWIAQLLSGRKTLPPQDDMMRSIKEFYRSKDLAGIPKRKTHDLEDFEYCDRYADYTGYPHLEEWRKELCLSVITNADANLETFKDEYDDHELLEIAYQSPHFKTFSQ